jgi:hypothetical protein
MTTKTTPDMSLDNVVKIGTCDIQFCAGQGVAEIALDTLTFDPVTLVSRAKPKQVRICMRHKSEYFRYQEALLDKINPERKNRAKQEAAQSAQDARRHHANVGNTSAVANRFRAFSS